MSPIPTRGAFAFGSTRRLIGLAREAARAKIGRRKGASTPPLSKGLRIELLTMRAR